MRQAFVGADVDVGVVRSDLEDRLAGQEGDLFAVRRWCVAELRLALFVSSRERGRARDGEEVDVGLEGDGEWIREIEQRRWELGVRWPDDVTAHAHSV